MSNLTEKAAYLKGLMQGLDIDQTTKEGKLLAAMVELMDEMSDAITDLESNQEAINDLVEAINEDLDELSDEFYGYDDLDEDEDGMMTKRCMKSPATAAAKPSIWMRTR